MKKIFVCVAVSLAMVMGFCFVTQAQAKDEIKLAVVEPLSGTFKDIGDRYLEGVEYAVQVINEKGGLLGKKVKIYAIDSELKPDIATRKAKKLILKEDVKYFMAGTGSSVGAAMSALALKSNVLMTSYGMEAASLTGGKCNKNFFRTICNSDTHSYALAAWVAKSGAKKVFGIAQDYSFGHEAMSAFVKKLNELNPSVKMVGKIFHKIGEKDFAPYVSQIINSGAEIVFTSNWGSDLTLLLKQAKPLGLKAKFVCYFLNDETAIQSVANDAAVMGSVTGEVYMLTIPLPANKEFVEGFHKAKGHYPSWLRGKSYQATMFWAKAVEKAGTDDVDAVRKAWEGLSYDGPSGTWYMRPCDHQAQVPIWIAEIVKENPFYKHAYVGTPTMIPAKDIAVPCAETGCPGLNK
ncbi:MAG: ABC transporter substrate-binding protein [Deltaproteobacteria bacterium]|nr:ABC transporter substrate-binding protein [Deltaproteobacteria bacterium]